MPLFGEKKPEISRKELKKVLKDTPDKTRGSFDAKKRIEMEKNFPKKYGSRINKSEFERTIKEMEKQRFYAKSTDERVKIDKDIRYLKELNK